MRSRVLRGVAAILVAGGAWLSVSTLAGATGSPPPNTNEVAYWCPFGGTKYDALTTTTFTVPAPPDGYTWTLLVLKAGSDQSVENENETFVNPTVGGTYHHSSYKILSHAILCHGPLTTTTTGYSSSTTGASTTAPSTTIATTTTATTIATTTTASTVPTTIATTTIPTTIATTTTGATTTIGTTTTGATTTVGQTTTTAGTTTSTTGSTTTVAQSTTTVPATTTTAPATTIPDTSAVDQTLPPSATTSVGQTMPVTGGLDDAALALGLSLLAAGGGALLLARRPRTS